MKRITDGFILPWLLLLLAIEVSTVSRHERRRYKRSWMSGTKPQGATCRINPCNVPNICNGGRKCELDDSCKHHCICTEDSTHESCVTTFASTVKPVITSPVTSTVTTTKVSCAFNSCNIPNYNISKYDGDASNACSSNYKLRNESERTCQTGMVCHFGVCVDKGDGRGQCECDPGAVGTLCTRKCCRNCGENGVCFLDGLEANCNCHYNYTGPDCSELKPQGQYFIQLYYHYFIIIFVILAGQQKAIKEPAFQHIEKCAPNPLDEVVLEGTGNNAVCSGLPHSVAFDWQLNQRNMHQIVHGGNIKIVH